MRVGGGRFHLMEETRRTEKEEYNKREREGGKEAEA